MSIDLDLTCYEMATAGEQFGWLCRRCVTIHMDAVMGDDGLPTQSGITLADLVESATEHEFEMHRVLAS